MKNYARVMNVDLSRYQRVIVLSDIHGDNDGFKATLSKLKFTNHDALVIVGDILEKGHQSLELLNNIMELYKQGNIYMVLGNNDTFFSEWFNDEVTDQDILGYMNSRDTSVLIEMANELNLEYKTIEQIIEFKNRIKEVYINQIEFLDKLPHIIDSNIATFVHAGLKPGNLNNQEIDYCLTAWEFGNKTNKFEKLVVVGHWPTSNYCDGIISIMPYYNKLSNVISIDGGNSMKSWRQINYLIFDKKGNYVVDAYDALPKIRILEKQVESKNPVSLIFPKTKLNVLNEKGDICECYFPATDRTIEINKNTIYTYKNETYCSDFTTYNLPTEIGDIVSFCKELDNGILIKRNGIVGKYYGKYEFIE